MKGPRPLMLGIILCAALSGAGPAGAFHEGGRGFCEGCHRLHRSGAPVGRTPSASTMLHGADPSSTCLRCHGESGAPETVLSPDGSSFTPGGDFYWLRKTFSWLEDRRTSTSPGDRHGHNVVALDYGLGPDGTRGVAPGGQFPSAGLECTSCHDPHLKRAGLRENGARPASGSPYRLLGGTGYAPGRGMVQFRHEAPIAVAPAAWRETDQDHVAYGIGMSEWCSNCHEGTGEAGNAHQHVAGSRARLGPAIAANYNAYVRTGQLTGSQAGAYLALVPFEVGTENLGALDPRSTSGPDSRATVMCLTCHRAHASAFTHAGRWDFSATFLADSHPRAGDAGAAPGDVANSYYGRNVRSRFGPYQRSLCNKCHVKD